MESKDVDIGLEGYKMLESLVHEVEAADQELTRLRAELSGRNLDSLPFQAHATELETNLCKKLPVEGLDEDIGVRYHLALGTLEKNNKSLKTLLTITQENKEKNEGILEDLEDHIKTQKELVARMEKKKAEMEAEAQTEAGRSAARRKLEDDLRTTNKISMEMKAFLREFINKMGEEEGLEPGNVPMGLLIQTLWTEFQNNDREGWIDIEQLDFEVREEDIQQLHKSEVIQCKNGNAKVIQLVDFTMRY